MKKFISYFVFLALISCENSKTYGESQPEIEKKLQELQEENSHLKLALELCQNHEDDLERAASQ